MEVGTAGTLTRGEDRAVHRNALFRIASMTKPMTAVAALMLVEDCRLRLDEPVDQLLPEMADRRVLVDAAGPLDGPTVPAKRPLTLRDLLDFRCGLGIDFDGGWPQPLFEAMGELGLGSGPPEPQVPPEPDEWMKRVSSLPLLTQPGERWLYNTRSDLLGVLIARAAGQPLDAFMRERVFAPLGMADTAFFTEDVGRLGTCYGVDPASGGRSVYDAPDGQWSRPPGFPSAAGGLVSTVEDVHAFGRMLLDNGRLPDGSRLLSPASVAVMTTDHIGVDRGAAGPTPDGSQGWGFGSACRCAAPASRAVSAATAGTAASAPRGRTTHTSDSSVRSSRPTASRARIPRLPSSRTSGRASLPRSTTDHPMPSAA
jgi:CubicO group peptidase (beta-lactamase class C family)